MAPAMPAAAARMPRRERTGRGSDPDCAGLVRAMCGPPCVTASGQRSGGAVRREVLADPADGGDDAGVRRWLDVRERQLPAASDRGLDPAVVARKRDERALDLPRCL